MWGSLHPVRGRIVSGGCRSNMTSRGTALQHGIVGTSPSRGIDPGNQMIAHGEMLELNLHDGLDD
jgi:hypothetical protein